MRWLNRISVLYLHKDFHYICAPPLPHHRMVFHQISLFWKLYEYVTEYLHRNLCHIQSILQSRSIHNFLKYLIILNVRGFCICYKTRLGYSHRNVWSLPGHGNSLQSFRSVFAPSHCFPPFRACVATTRVRIWFPPPQVFEHCVQFPYSPHLQSIGTKTKFNH